MFFFDPFFANESPENDPTTKKMVSNGMFRCFSIVLITIPLLINIKLLGSVFAFLGLILALFLPLFCFWKESTRLKTGL